MKKFILLIFFSLLFSIIFTETRDEDLLATENDEAIYLKQGFDSFLFDFDFGVGLFLGEFHELVYDSNGMISDLRWPMYPSISVFANAEVELKKGFHLKINSEFCPKIRSGKLTDKDYSYSNGNKELVGDSIHDGFLEWRYAVGGKVGWKFVLPQTKYLKQTNTGFSIEPTFGVQYSRMKFSAADGYGWYDNHLHKEKYSGTQITYQVQKVITSFGLDLHFIMPKNIYLKTGFEIIPYYFATSLDNHFLRNIIFYDELKVAGFGLGLNSELKWLFSNYWGLVFGLEYKFMINKLGSTKIYQSGFLTKVLPKGSSGQKSDLGKLYLGFFVRAKK